MLRIFPYVYWLPVCLLWRSVYSGPLPIFKFGCFFGVEFCKFFISFGYYPLIRYIIRKYVLPFGKLSFWVFAGFLCCDPIFLNPLPAPGEASTQASSSVCADVEQKGRKERWDLTVVTSQTPNMTCWGQILYYDLLPIDWYLKHVTISLCCLTKFWCGSMQGGFKAHIWET